MSEDPKYSSCRGYANSITVPLPDGVMLVNETRGTSGSGNVKVSGGDTFYLRADVAYGNGTTWSSGEIRGEIAKSWKILLVKTGNGSQDIGIRLLCSRLYHHQSNCR